MKKLDEIIDSANVDWWNDGQTTYEDGIQEKNRIKREINNEFNKLLKQLAISDEDYRNLKANYNDL